MKGFNGSSTLDNKVIIHKIRKSLPKRSDYLGNRGSEIPIYSTGTAEERDCLFSLA